MNVLRRIDKRVVWIFVVLVLIVFMMDFNARMSELLALEKDRDSAAAEVTDLANTQWALVTQIAYATSEAGVEEWAREEAGMVKSGEVPIVPLVETATTPDVETTQEPAVPVVENWQVWQALLFGE